MLHLYKGDITALPFSVECIVNSANPSLLRGGGVCGAIFKKAGYELDEACAQIGPQIPVNAVITPGFNLAPSIIHTVIPRYDGHPKRFIDLREGYLKAIDLALQHEIKSIAFPSIGTGIYGYPLEMSAKIAIEILTVYAQFFPEIKITLVCFDEDTYQAYLKAQKTSEGIS